MIIRDFHLDGFGVFNNVEVTGLSSGLNIFYGDNEAGKSTLLAFFRAVFFGFPDGRRSVQAPPPLCGGEHGGLIVLAGAGPGTVMISRHRKNRSKPEILFENGQKGGEEELRLLFAGVTEPLFNSIYTFSLKELAEFKNLTDEAVKGALFGASFGAGMHTFADAFKKLGNVKEELFKSGGSKPAINQELAALSEIRKKIVMALKDQDRYSQVTSELSEAETLAGELALLRKELGRERLGLENTVKLWADWVVFRDTAARMEALGPGHSGFPPRGIERLERLISLADKEKYERAKCLAEKEDHEADLKAWTVDPLLEENAAAIERLNENLAAFRENVRELSGKNGRIAGLMAEADGICRGLGPDWTRERLKNADCSVFVKQDLDDKGKALLEAERAVEKAREILGVHFGTAREAEAEEARAAENAALYNDDTVMDYADMAGVRKNLRLCRDLETEARGLEKEAEFAQVRAKDHEGRVYPLWVVFAPVFAGLVFAAPFFYYAGVLQGVGVVLAALVVCGFLFFQRKRNTKIFEEARKGAENANRAWRDSISRLNELAGESGFTGNDWDGMAEALDRREREQADRENRRQAAEAALEKAKEAARTARNRRDEAGTGLEKAVAAHDETLSAWKEGLSSLGLPADLSPKTAFDAFGFMENGARIVRELENAISEAAEIEKRISSFKTDAQRVIAACGREIATDEILDSSVRLIQSDLKKNMDAKAELIRLSELAAALGRRICAHDKELLRLDSEVKNLLESAGARDIDEFMELGARAEEHARLSSAHDVAARNLLTISGEADLDALCRRLLALDPQAVSERLDEVRGLLERVEADLETARQRAADSKSLLEKIASDTVLAELRLEECAVRERLRVLALSWGRHATALELLSQARSRFEESERPTVIKEAESLFAKITDGAYTRLHTPTGQLEIEAEAPSGVRRKTSELSRGTAEQLYLCLRLAYARAGAARHGGIPLVMDDVFVNFDHPRAERAAMVLSDIARSMQVLYFTCHAHTFDMFRQVAPDSGFFRLDGGVIEKASSASPS
ncbi:MAG: AAA family ATPase [Deltaproteobacteria bacterium]|nr:AAA family ATPase [Deltaproteobacteria bacterium]